MEKLLGLPSENLWHLWSNILRKNSSQKLFNRVLSLSFWTNDVTNFPKVTWIILPQTVISDFLLLSWNFLIKEERIDNVVSTTNWFTPVHRGRARVAFSEDLPTTTPPLPLREVDAFFAWHTSHQHRGPYSICKTLQKLRPPFVRNFATPPFTPVHRPLPPPASH